MQPPAAAQAAGARPRVYPDPIMDLHNRRAFLRAAAAAGVAWSAADLLAVEDALAWSAGQAKTGGGFTALSAAEGEAVDALTARIIPSVDKRPGAHEAGVVFFVDRALATFNAGQKKMYTDGIQDLNRRAADMFKGAAFAKLAAAQQDAVIRAIEKTPFFQAVRFDTIVGTFALPSWGGNRDYAGWHMIGLEHQARFQPPFGAYDVDANRRK
jgi:gluconate 2-dehydrogenase gamma chain